MNTNFAYDKADILQVVEYHLIYPEEKVYPTICSLLENIPREKIVRFSQLLVNLYSNASIEDMQNFFSPENGFLKDDFNKRFKNARKEGIEYIFTTAQTPLELLRYAFSTPYQSGNLDSSSFEENLLKVILLINERLHVHGDIQKDSNKKIEACKLVLANSFSQSGFNSNNYNQTFRFAFTKSVDFFEYVSKNNYFKPIYNRFITKIGISNYRQYIKTIIGVFAVMKLNAEHTLKEIGVELWMGDFPFIEDRIQDDLISKNVLDFLSMDIDDVVPLQKNEDYVHFRNKPLIKNKDGTYAVYNLIFLFERLFNSLYFDFQHIAIKELHLPKFGIEYKERFFEETLLHSYISRINHNNRYLAINGVEAKNIKENGAPDYFLKNRENNSIILFEHKDIRIKGSVKQSRNVNIIIDEYKNKILSVVENHGEKLKHPTPIGIGQLINLIEKIRNNDFVWDSNANYVDIIYPVLVLTDINIIPDGLPYLMNQWFYENLKAKGIDVQNIKPLIVIEVSTLLLYSDEFRENSLEYYIEKYYKMIRDAENNGSNNLFLSLANMCVSFSEYMLNAYPKDFTDLHEEFKDLVFNQE